VVLGEDLSCAATSFLLGQGGEEVRRNPVSPRCEGLRVETRTTLIREGGRTERKGRKYFWGGEGKENGNNGFLIRVLERDRNRIKASLQKIDNGGTAIIRKGVKNGVAG